MTRGIGVLVVIKVGMVVTLGVMVAVGATWMVTSTTSG